MLSTTVQSNYLAKVVKLDKFTKHPNADKLLIWNVGNYEVITNLDYQPGDIVIHFPVECQISDKILSNLNLYSDKELNTDKEQVGYIHKSRRVKAVKLRGIVSEGMLLDFHSVLHVLNTTTYRDDSKLVGTEFDTIHGEVICNKYVPPANLKGEPGSPKDRKKKLLN